MSIIDDIYQGVVIKTARPDRIKEIKQAVVDAMNEYHSLAFFERDIRSGVLNIGSAAQGQVDLRNYIPNLRKVMGVFCHGKKLQKIGISEQATCPSYQLLDSILQIVPTNYSNMVTVAYAVTPTLDTSWIVTNYKDAMIALAAGKVANIVGNRALAAALFLEVGSIFPARTGYKHQIMMENDQYEPDL